MGNRTNVYLSHRYSRWFWIQKMANRTHRCGHLFCEVVANRSTRRKSDFLRRRQPGPGCQSPALGTHLDLLVAEAMVFWPLGHSQVGELGKRCGPHVSPFPQTWKTDKIWARAVNMFVEPEYTAIHDDNIPVPEWSVRLGINFLFPEGFSESFSRLTLSFFLGE